MNLLHIFIRLAEEWDDYEKSIRIEGVVELGKPLLTLIENELVDTCISERVSSIFRPDGIIRSERKCSNSTS